MEGRGAELRLRLALAAESAGDLQAARSHALLVRQVTFQLPFFFVSI